MLRKFIYHAFMKKKNYIFNQFNWYWQLLLYDLPFSLNVAFDGPSRDCVYIDTCVQSLNRRRGPSLYDNMVPLNRAANTQRFLLLLRLSVVRAARENAGVWTRACDCESNNEAHTDRSGNEEEKWSKGRGSFMSHFYRVSRFAVSTEKSAACSRVGALPNERNSTSDDRASMLSHRPS